MLTKDRWSALPEVPSIEEAGVPSLYVSYWHGLWAPKGAPKDIIDKLNGAVVSALADATVRQRFTEIGQEVWPREQQTPQALAAYHKAETEKWWPIIRASNLKAEESDNRGACRSDVAALGFLGRNDACELCLVR